MLKVTTAVLAVALAGSASAAGWRSLRFDGSSEASFATSVAQFKETLSPARYQVFLRALEDVWEQGTKNAEAKLSEYTADDYRRQLDGLAYKQVVTLTDPTGETAKTRLRDAITNRYGAPRSGHDSRPGYASPPLGSPWMPQERPRRETGGNPDAARDAGH
jgi:hypothetical protein